MGVISLGTLFRWMDRTVAAFVLRRGSMLWGVVESGLMAAFFESGRRFFLTMRTPASELCFIVTEDTRSRNCSNPDRIGVHATIQKR
jgi:hypothetical protein